MFLQDPKCITGSAKTLCTRGEDHRPLVQHPYRRLTAARTGTKVCSRGYAQRVKEASRLMREGWHGRRADTMRSRGRGRRQHRDSFFQLTREALPGALGISLDNSPDGQLQPHLQGNDHVVL